MRNVLITGARAPIARDLARSFGAAGRSSHLADSVHPWTVSFGHDTRDRFRCFASPRFSFDAFATDLCRLVEDLDPESCADLDPIDEGVPVSGFPERGGPDDSDGLRLDVIGLK